MALARAEIQRKSNEKKGVRPKTYILSEETIAHIDCLAKETGLSKGALIAEMTALYAQHKNIAL